MARCYSRYNHHKDTSVSYPGSTLFLFHFFVLFFLLQNLSIYLYIDIIKKNHIEDQNVWNNNNNNKI